MNLLGKATDKSFWSETVRNDKLYEKFVLDFKNVWERLCEDKEIPELSYNKFKQFFITGERRSFEKVYFENRGRLSASAILSLIYPEETKYVDYLNDIIFAICNEYTWSVSAHHPDINVYNKTHIDLFAAETGFALAEIYTLLGDRLDTLIKGRIKAEINERIIDSFMSDKVFNWTRNCTNNWAAVCGGSVGCTFMLMRPDLFDQVKPRLDKVMESYLSGFEDDGYCLEGTGYWHYGFGFFISYADMLKRYTDGAEDYFARPKIRTIATFLQKAFLTETTSVSFADGDETSKYHIGTLHYLKTIYPDDVKVFSHELSYEHDNCFRFCLLLGSAIWRNADIYNNPDSLSANEEYYAENSEWYIKRSAKYSFAAKGGHNAEPHNHNDVGTFIFAKDGKQIIVDMGRGLYSKQYFNKATRYDFIECSSLGHNVPYFNEDIAQSFGAEYAASDVSFENGVLSMDLAPAYKDDAVKSIKRSFTLGEDNVVVSDTFDHTAASVTDRLVTLIKPTVEDGVITLDSAKITYDAALADVSVCEKDTSKKLHLYLIDFKLKEGVTHFEFTVE